MGLHVDQSHNDHGVVRTDMGLHVDQSHNDWCDQQCQLDFSAKSVMITMMCKLTNSVMMTMMCWAKSAMVTMWSGMSTFTGPLWKKQSWCDQQYQHTLYINKISHYCSAKLTLDCSAKPVMMWWAMSTYIGLFRKTSHDVMSNVNLHWTVQQNQSWWPWCDQRCGNWPPVARADNWWEQRPLSLLCGSESQSAATTSGGCGRCNQWTLWGCKTHTQKMHIRQNLWGCKTKNIYVSVTICKSNSAGAVHFSWMVLLLLLCLNKLLHNGETTCLWAHFWFQVELSWKCTIFFPSRITIHFSLDTNENTAHAGKNGYCCGSCSCCSLAQYRWPKFLARDNEALKNKNKNNVQLKSAFFWRFCVFWSSPNSPLLHGRWRVVEPGQVACDGAVVTPVAAGNLQRKILSDAGLELAAEGVFVEAAASTLGVALWKWTTAFETVSDDRPSCQTRNS